MMNNEEFDKEYKIYLAVRGIENAICNDDITIFKPTNQSIVFMVGEKKEAIMELTESGNIYVKGNLIKKDTEVYLALRELLFGEELPKDLKGEED